MPSDFESEVEVLVEAQAGEEFVSLGLAELGLTYVDEIPTRHRAFFLARCVALWEESQ